MKLIKLLFIGILFCLSNTLQAQVSVNINIGSPPLWGPVGYTEVRYYYLPDVEAYYDIQSSMFIYIYNGVWIHRNYLPSRYRGYDLYGGYKVVMPNYHGNSPYIYFKEHKIKYAKGYHGKQQNTIGKKPGRSSNSSYKSNNNGNSNNKVGQSTNNNSGNHHDAKKGKGNGGGGNKKK